MKILFFSVFIFSNLISFSYAEKVINNFENALNYYRSGDQEKATFFIKKNFSKRKTHLPSLILWSKILTKKKKFSKAELII